MMDAKERIISDEIKKLIPVLGKENASRISKAYLLGDEDTRKKIFEMIDAVKASVFSDRELRESPLLEPPPRDISTQGDLEFGTVMYGKKALYPFKLNKNLLMSHVGIFGSSGYGKTNLSYWLVDKISELDIPILIFDFSKRNYKDLLNTDLKNKIDVYTVGRDVSPFRFNPLKPPKGVLLSQWMKEFASIFDHAYWLLGGGRHIIFKALSAVYDVKEKTQPRIVDLQKWINEYGEEKMATRERNWLATASRPLDSLTFKEVGEIFNCDEGINPADFFKPGKITILEMDSLDTNDKTFIIEIMIQWIRDWLLVGSSREKMKGVIILEEAHHVLNRDKSQKTGSETVMELLFREIRELGIGVVYIDQHPSLVSYPALGNTSTHIYMNLGLDTKQSSDIHDACNMLGLNYHEDGDMIRKLGIGDAFMLTRMSTFHDPFLIKFKPVSIQKGSVSDETIIRHMRDRIIPDQKKGYETVDLDIANAENLSEKELDIIKIIGSGKGAFASQIYREARMSGTKFEAASKRLANANILSMRPAIVGKNKMHFYFLTEKGERVLDEYFPGAGTKIDKETARIDDLLEVLDVQRKGNTLFFEKDGRQLKVAVLVNNDKAEISEALENHHYFICATDKAKNMLFQQAAKYSREQLSKHEFYFAMLKKFRQNFKFERVTIQRGS